MSSDDVAVGLYEERPGASAYVECTWQARAVREERYLVPAIEHWDIWFAREPDGSMVAAAVGPVTAGPVTIDRERRGDSQLQLQVASTP